MKKKLEFYGKNIPYAKFFIISGPNRSEKSNTTNSRVIGFTRVQGFTRDQGPINTRLLSSSFVHPSFFLVAAVHLSFTA